MVIPADLDAIVRPVLDVGAWIIGSTPRKLARDETDFTDIDIVLRTLAANYRWKQLPKRTLRGHMSEICGFRFHVAPQLNFAIPPMFDVNMLGVSKHGLSLRPQSPSERTPLVLEEVLANIRAKQFRIIPARERSPYFPAKLAALLADGWTQLPS